MDSSSTPTCSGDGTHQWVLVNSYQDTVYVPGVPYTTFEPVPGYLESRVKRRFLWWTWEEPVYEYYTKLEEVTSYTFGSSGPGKRISEFVCPRCSQSKRVES